jgi:hypothetical protein
MNETSGPRVGAHASISLTDNNTVGSTTGKLGNAASFVAANGERLDGGDILDIDAGSLTVSCWFRTNASDSIVPLIGKSYSSSRLGRYAIYLTSGKVAFVVEDTTGNLLGESTSTYNDGNWHLAVLVIDRANGAYLYVDNVLVGSVTRSITGTLNSPDPFVIGFYSKVNKYLDGDVDQSGVWRTAFDATKVGMLWNGGAGTTYPFL